MTLSIRAFHEGTNASNANSPFNQNGVDVRVEKMSLSMIALHMFLQRTCSAIRMAVSGVEALSSHRLHATQRPGSNVLLTPVPPVKLPRNKPRPQQMYRGPEKDVTL